MRLMEIKMETFMRVRHAVFIGLCWTFVVVLIAALIVFSIMLFVYWMGPIGALVWVFPAVCITIALIEEFS